MRESEAWRRPRPQAMALPGIGIVVMLLVGTMVMTPAVAGPRLAEARTATPVMRGPVAVWVDRDGGAWIPGTPAPGP
ncbi:MAG TPA: hypothetical protein VLK84_14485, partial [Longimicrobium sp.]|nr:hypothetical protein [Longimicrobium sp.]